MPRLVFFARADILLTWRPTGQLAPLASQIAMYRPDPVRMHAGAHRAPAVNSPKKRMQQERNHANRWRSTPSLYEKKTWPLNKVRIKAISCPSSAAIIGGLLLAEKRAVNALCAFRSRAF
jgi:hypothetical protein